MSDHAIEEIKEIDLARALRLAVTKNVFDQGFITADEARQDIR